VLLPGLRTMLPVPAISLVLLTLLALGAFLAGVSFLSPQICFLGLALALAVPAIAWLNRSALFDLGGRLVDRAWHNLLATSSWPSGRKIG
jgi:hypothetical protein